MRKVFGGLLLALGILIAGLSGLCTVMMFTSSGTPVSADEILESLPIVLIFGGIPFVMGLGLVFAGRSLLRERGQGG